MSSAFGSVSRTNATAGICQPRTLATTADETTPSESVKQANPTARHRRQRSKLHQDRYDEVPPAATDRTRTGAGNRLEIAHSGAQPRSARSTPHTAILGVRALRVSK